MVRRITKSWWEYILNRIEDLFGDLLTSQGHRHYSIRQACVNIATMSTRSLQFGQRREPKVFDSLSRVQALAEFLWWKECNFMHDCKVRNLIAILVGRNRYGSDWGQHYFSSISLFTKMVQAGHYVQLAPLVSQVIPKVSLKGNR